MPPSNECTIGFVILKDEDSWRRWMEKIYPHLSTRNMTEDDWKEKKKRYGFPNEFPLFPLIVRERWEEGDVSCDLTFQCMDLQHFDQLAKEMGYVRSG